MMPDPARPYPPRMARTDRRSSGRRPRSAATSPGWSRRPASSARLGLLERLRGAGRARRHDAASTTATSAERPGLGARPGPACEEPRADHRRTSRACATHVADASGAATAPRRPAPAARRRLHVARRGDGRPASGPARSAGSRSPGSTPTATSTRPTRRRRATSGGCRSRCSAAAAIRISSRPATGRRSARRMPRCSAARSSTSRSRGCSPPRRSRTSGRGCWPSDGRPGRARGVGADGRRRGSTPRTSRSTSTRSTSPAAGP